MASPPLEVLKRRVDIVLEAMFQWWACHVKPMAGLDDLMFFFHPNRFYDSVTVHCVNPACGAARSACGSAHQEPPHGRQNPHTGVQADAHPRKKILFSAKASYVVFLLAVTACHRKQSTVQVRGKAT